MGLFPRDTIEKINGRTIRTGTCGWRSRDIEYDSDLITFPFTYWKIMWFNKTLNSWKGYKVKDLYYREKVEEIQKNTNLYPVLTEFVDWPSDEFKMQDLPLVTDADWEYIPNGGYIIFKTVSGAYAGCAPDIWGKYKRFGITQFDVAKPGQHHVSVGFNPEKEVWYG